MNAQEASSVHEIYLAFLILGVRVAAPAPLPVDLWAPVGNKRPLLWLADAGRSPAFWEKARGRAICALKQSGGAWLPELLAPSPLPGLLGSKTLERCTRVVLEAEGCPGGGVPETTGRTLDDGERKPV